MLEVNCPFYGCEVVAIREQLESLDDLCSQCTVINDCREIAFAPKAIGQVVDLALLPPYLASKFELIRILAASKLEELLQEG